MFELVLVGLFVALTPGILFKLKGSKMMTAAAHAALFGVVVYVVSSYFISYDGFQAGPQPICPSGTTYSDGLCRSSVVCPSGYKFSPISGKCISSSMGGSTQRPGCPANTVLHDNGWCYQFIEVNCPSGGRTDGDNCVIEPISCPEPYVLSRGQCITPPQTKSMSMLQARKSTSFTKAPTTVGITTKVSSVIDKNGNTISVGSIASCIGAKGTFNITVTRIESSPNSTIVRGTVNGSKKAYKLSSCSAVTASESIFG